MTSTQSRSGWEQTIADLGDRAESEVQRVVRYMNNEIVPEIRKDTSRLLRSAADELLKLAQRMEARRAPNRGYPEDRP